MCVFLQLSIHRVHTASEPNLGGCHVMKAFIIDCSFLAPYTLDEPYLLMQVRVRV